MDILRGNVITQKNDQIIKKYWLEKGVAVQNDDDDDIQTTDSLEC